MMSGLVGRAAVSRGRFVVMLTGMLVAGCKAQLTLPAQPQPVALALESVEPASGYAGTRVRLRGRLPAVRAADVSVTIGASGAQSPLAVAPDGSWLEVRVPDTARSGAGPVDIEVLAPQGSARLVGAFRYLGADALRYRQVVATHSLAPGAVRVAGVADPAAAVVLASHYEDDDGVAREVFVPFLVGAEGQHRLRSPGHTRPRVLAAGSSDDGKVAALLAAGGGADCPDALFALDVLDGEALRAQSGKHDLDARTATACIPAPAAALDCSRPEVVLDPRGQTALVVCPYAFGGLWTVDLTRSPPAVAPVAAARTHVPGTAAAFGEKRFVLGFSGADTRLLLIDVGAATLQDHLVPETAGLTVASVASDGAGRVALAANPGVSFLDAGVMPPRFGEISLQTSDTIMRLAFAGDGRYLAAQSFDALSLFDLHSGSRWAAAMLQSDLLFDVAAGRHGVFIAGQGSSVLHVTPHAAVVSREHLTARPRSVQFIPRIERTLEVEGTGGESMPFSWNVLVTETQAGERIGFLDADKSGVPVVWRRLPVEGAAQAVPLGDGFVVRSDYKAWYVPASGAPVRVAESLRGIDDLVVTPGGEAVIVVGTDEKEGRIHVLQAVPGGLEARSSFAGGLPLTGTFLGIHAWPDGRAAAVWPTGVHLFDWRAADASPHFVVGKDQGVAPSAHFRLPRHLLVVDEEWTTTALDAATGRLVAVGTFPDAWTMNLADQRQGFVASPGGTRLYWPWHGASGISLSSVAFDPETLRFGANEAPIEISGYSAELQLAIAPDGESLVVVDVSGDRLFLVR